jgi:hypothetical protein
MASCKAVICGINDYPPPNDLPSCVNDARAVARLLQERYNCRDSDVHMVLNREATVNKVESELEWLINHARASDWLLFYYSGHGFTQLVDGVMEEFLVLLDESGQPALWKDDRLVALTQELADGKLTLLMDCCFSGGMKQ